MCSKDTDGIANSADPAQMTHTGLLFYLGVHCLLRTVCSTRVHVCCDAGAVHLHSDVVVKIENEHDVHSQFS